MTIEESPRTSSAAEPSPGAVERAPVDFAKLVGTSALEDGGDDDVDPTDFDGRTFGPESDTSPGTGDPIALAPRLLPRIEEARAPDSSRPRRPPPPPPPDDDDEVLDVSTSELELVGLALPPRPVERSAERSDRPADRSRRRSERPVRVLSAPEAPIDRAGDAAEVDRAAREAVDAARGAAEVTDRARHPTLVDAEAGAANAEAVEPAELALAPPVRAEAVEPAEAVLAAPAEAAAIAPEGAATEADERPPAGAPAEARADDAEPPASTGDIVLAEIAKLEAECRAAEDWEGLRAVLTRRSHVEAEPEARARALVARANVEADELEDDDRAERTLEEALTFAPGSRVVLEALASVEERRGRVDKAIAALRRLAEAAVPALAGSAKARVFVRIGRLAARGLDDGAAAVCEYEAALAADPHCLDAIHELLALRDEAERYAEAMELAVRAAALTDDPNERGQLWLQAAELAHEQLHDEVRATEYYGRGVALVPDDFVAAATLGELYLKRGDHERAYPHLRRAADGLTEPGRMAYLYNAAGQAADKAGKVTEAIECFEAALVRAPRAFEPLRRLGALLESSASWARVIELSSAFLQHHEANLAPAERASVYARMARAKRALGDLEGAAKLARTAHEIAKDKVEPLQLLADVLAEAGKASEAAELLSKLSALLPTPHEKRNALHRAAVLLAEERQDLPRATTMLAEAQTHVPDDVEVAELLARYRARLQDASGAVDALTVSARLLSGRAKADLLVRAARLARPDGVVRGQVKKLYTEALELAPAHPDALDDLRRILELDRDYGALVALLETSAAKALEDPDVREARRDDGRRATARALYEDAVRVAAFHLRDPARALVSARRLVELAPLERRYREEVARLVDRLALEAAPTDAGASTALEEAIAAWSRLVEEEPGFLEGLRRLRTLRARAGDHAVARLTDDLLVALGDPSGAPTEGGESRAPRGERPARTKLVFPPHPSETSRGVVGLGALFADLGYAPLEAFFELLPGPKPKKREMVSNAGLGAASSRALEGAAAVLGVEPPPVYVRSDVTEPVTPALAHEEPALVVSLSLLERRSESELAFLFGRGLSLLRPRALALATVPLDLFRDALHGFARPALDPDELLADPKRAKKLGKSLEKALAPGERVRLGEDVGRWLRDPSRRTLGDERAAVLRTAERAGLVASGSLSAAIAAMKDLSDGRVERIWHLPLLEYAATESFAEIVRKLG